MPKKYWVFIFALIYWCNASILGHKHQLEYMYSDEEGYYLYLPAVFIYGTFEHIPVRTTSEYKPYPGTHKIATRFTYGVALLVLPFFLVAHALRWVQGFSLDDPFAVQYSVAILVAACFYVTLGLYFLQGVLLRHFKNRYLIGLTLFLVFFGTNILYYTSRVAGMSHPYTFFLVSALLYYLPVLYREPSGRNALRIGIILGTIALVRPTNLIFVPFALCYDIRGKQDMVGRMNWMARHFKTLSMIPLVMALLAIPQMAYWHYLSGKYLLNTYSELLGQRFYWTKPHLFQVFFDLCNGFFVYTPLMALAVCGILMMAHKNVGNGRLLAVTFAGMAYVLSCWCQWWFGGAYGYRSFIDFYPLLAIGLCHYLHWAYATKPGWVWYCNLLLLSAFVFVNIRMVSFYYAFQVQADGTDSALFWGALRKCLWL